NGTITCTVGGAQKINVATGNTLTLFGAITSSFGLNVNRSGTGVLVLGAANPNFSGTINMNAGSGTLAIAADNALGTGDANIASSTLDFRNVNYASTVEGIITVTSTTLLSSTGASTYAGRINLSGSDNTFSLANALTLAGVVSGSVLTKTGAAT